MVAGSCAARAAPVYGDRYCGSPELGRPAGDLDASPTRVEDAEMMNQIDLFTAALGISAPWRIVNVTFDPQARRLDVRIDFDPGTRFSCPECDAANCAVHDTQQKTWRHLDFFQHEAHLHARVPRVNCPVHKVHLAAVPWARQASGFTLLFEALAMAMMTEMPVACVARIVRCRDKKLWRVLHHYVDSARAEMSAAKVRAIGIDETSARRGQDYITLFVDLASSQVLFATEGRGQDTVERFAIDLRRHDGDPAAITEVCQDMSPAFAAGVDIHLPNAEITYDRYHIMQQLTQALDQVRRSEVKTCPELKGTRYTWLKNARNLTARQQAELAYLMVEASHLQTVRAYNWRLKFERFFSEPAGLAGAYLKRWCDGAIRSRLEPIKKFVRMVRAHWDGIVRWHTTKISNGVLEGINSLIQAAKRRARGYRSLKNLIAMTYLIAGRLDVRCGVQ